MFKQILFLSVFVFLCPMVFAAECVDDDKLILIKENQIGYSMYNETVYTNQLKKCSSYDLTCDLYTGGEWKLRNRNSHDLNVVGRAFCLDSYEFNNGNKYGSHCYCKIQELDNYKVLSDWVYVKHYQNYIFDENQTYSSEADKKFKQNDVISKNIKDCENNCAQSCQSYLSNLIKAVRGYYVCDKALYKATDVICSIDKQLVKAKTIFVFDDTAEIKTKDDSIVFIRDKNDTKNLTYVGTYAGAMVYLKVVNNKIYVGDKTYSLEQCL